MKDFLKRHSLMIGILLLFLPVLTGSADIIQKILLIAVAFMVVLTAGPEKLSHTEPLQRQK